MTPDRTGYLGKNEKATDRAECAWKIFTNSPDPLNLNLKLKLFDQTSIARIAKLPYKMCELKKMSVGW